MGSLDEFLRTQTAVRIAPNESVMGFAHARSPMRYNGLGVPTAYTNYLVIATSTRLILFYTEADGLTGDAPRPAAAAKEIWEYDELANVECGSVAGITQATWFKLTPHPTCGPMLGQSARYDIYPVARGLDGQGQFQQSYARWLQPRVASRAFPMPEAKRAAVDARIAAAQAAINAKARAQADQLRKAEPMVARVIVGLVLLGLAGFAMLVLSTSIRRYDGEPLYFPPPTGSISAEESRITTQRQQEAEESRTAENRSAGAFAAISGVSLLVILGSGIGLLLWDKNKRATAARQPV